MSHVFVSIVGTQIMGTLHPRRVFLRTCPGGKSILLATDGTRELALRLKAWAQENDGCDVDILPIPMTAGTKDGAAAVAVRLAEETQAAGGRLFFNLDGGLNYLVADCVMALGACRPVFMQSSEMRTLAFDTEAGLVKRLPDADTLSVQDILALQGVSWSRAGSSSPLVQWCSQHGVTLPEGCETNVVIDGVTFELAWNPGSNRISFLKDLRFLPADSSERLSRERALIHWAVDRKRSAQMYDRRVYAVVHDEKTEHRLRSESCGKIEAFDDRGELGEHTPLRRKLTKIFERKAVFKVHLRPVLENLLPAPAEGAEVCINITPGTKGQGAMLAWWGCRHGCSVWSIDNRQGLCVPLFAPHGERPVRAVPCDMETRFRIEGVLLRETKELSQEDRLLYRTMLAFMRAALDEGGDDGVMKKAVSAGGMSLEPGKDKVWTLNGNGTEYRFSTEGGEWLEKLAAAALEEAGFSNVRHRIRFSWPEEMEKNIRRAKHLSPDDDVFSQDLDVAASRNNDIVVMSCKANPFSSVKEAAAEVASTGERLGRFALRMLLYFSEKDSFMGERNVMVLGWRHLCRREELLKIIETLRFSLQTTEK